MKGEEIARARARSPDSLPFTFIEFSMPRANRNGQNGSHALALQFNPIIYYELDICSILHIDKISQCFCFFFLSPFDLPFALSCGLFSIS